jgi:hypothetical protein
LITNIVAPGEAEDVQWGIKLDATELSHVWELNTEGKWVTLGEETCRKPAAAKPEATKPAEHKE